MVATPGLQNQIGEYNCFLNVVIQCLWHCTVFKARFSALAQDSPATVQVCSPSCSCRAEAGIAAVVHAMLQCLQNGTSLGRSAKAPAIVEPAKTR